MQTPIHVFASHFFFVILLHEAHIGLCEREDGMIAVARAVNRVPGTTGADPAAVPASDASLPAHMENIKLPDHMFPYEKPDIHDSFDGIRSTQDGLKQKTDELFVHSTLLSKQLSNYGHLLGVASKKYIKMMGLVGDSLTEESTGLIQDEKDRLGSMSEVTKEIEEVTNKGRQDPSDAKLPDEIVQAADLQHIDTFEQGAANSGEPTVWHPLTPGTTGVTPATPDITPAGTPGEKPGVPAVTPEAGTVTTAALEGDLNKFAENGDEPGPVAAAPVAAAPVAATGSL